MDAGLGQAGLRDDYFQDLFEDTEAGQPKDSTIRFVDNPKMISKANPGCQPKQKEEVVGASFDSIYIV